MSNAYLKHVGFSHMETFCKTAILNAEKVLLKFYFSFRFLCFDVKGLRVASLKFVLLDLAKKLV